MELADLLQNLIAGTLPRTSVVGTCDEYDVYIGRAGRGESGYFANKWIAGVDGTRDEVLAKFEIDFKHRVETDPVFRSRVLALRGKRLGCPGNCAPRGLTCHGHIMARWIDAQPV